MKRNIEASLRRAVEVLPQPDYFEVSSQPVQPMEVHDYITRQEAPSPVLRRRRVLSLAACACVLALIVGAVSYLQFFQVYSWVTLQVNPSFYIQLNRQDKIRSIEGANGDARDLLEGRSYQGWTLDAAVGALMDEMAAKGYLSGPESGVTYSVGGRSPEHAETLRLSLSALVSAKLDALPAPAEPTTPLPPEPSAAPPGQMLTQAELEAVVQSHAPGAVCHHVKLEQDDDAPSGYLYEVEVKDGHTKYEAELDAYSGEILKWEEDD